MINNKKYSAILEDFVREHNKLRSNPKTFIPALMDRMYRLDDQGKYVLSPGVVVKTVEGKAAIQEAIEFLENIDEISSELVINEALCKVAQSHASDLGKHGMVGHIGSQGSTLDDRLSLHVEAADCRGENICFSLDKTAREHIVDLLIDDGVESRPHRLALFNSAFSCMGLGYADHSLFGKCIVIDYGKNIVCIESLDENESKSPVFDSANLEVAEHFDGLLDKYFKKKFKRAYTMDDGYESYSKSPRPASKSSKERKERERRKSHLQVPIEKIKHDHDFNESNKSVN